MLPINPPDAIFCELFEAVQTQRVFLDSKTFADAIPKEDPAVILAAYRTLRDEPGFDLALFVAARFELPQPTSEPREGPKTLPLRQRIEALWDILQRSPDIQRAHSSLIPLPRPYIVPGGRFQEIYYWDSYFTMLGLAPSGRVNLIQDMVDNFAFLINRVGFIPNGNRTYYCSRSQPPLFASMVTFLAEVRGDPQIVTLYLNELEQEYRFWMSGAEVDGDELIAGPRVIRVEDGFLNRYWDDLDTPRLESYAEDLLLAQQLKAESSQLFRDLRAACESGWDFSSRWLADGQSLASIRTTQVVPVDLNAIMFNLESTLANACGLAGRPEDERFYRARANTRKRLLKKLLFDETAGFFVDVLLPDFKPTGVFSLAAAFPLFFGIAGFEQAERTRRRLYEEFLKPGGWVTTLTQSSQQWDAPNGWAPLQWIVYEGLQRYGFSHEADEGARRWVENNQQVYERSGRLMEKYNVEHIGLFAGGGEYEVQHGFGWTNGVLVNLMDRLG